MQGRDGSGSQRRKAFCKVAPIPSTLLFAPLTQTLLSPSFCNLSQQFWQVALLKCTNSSSWQKVPDLVSPQFASWAVSSGSSWVTIPVSEKPRSCLLRLGRGTHWGWAGNRASLLLIVQTVTLSGIGSFSLLERLTVWPGWTCLSSLTSIRSNLDGGGVGSGFGCCLAKPVGCIWRPPGWCWCHHSVVLGAAGSSARHHQLATASACPYVPTQGWPPDHSAPGRNTSLHVRFRRDERVNCLGTWA